MLPRHDLLPAVQRESKDVAEPAGAGRTLPSLAIVGMACRFPDAGDAPELLDMVLTGRRAFRRIPPARLDLADYFQPDRDIHDATYSTRAALLEGWQFDPAAFGIDPAVTTTADPALWLALETSARALAGAGLARGRGLQRDRTGVIVGNTLGGDTSRANALRARWPYVRRVLSGALGTELPAEQAEAVLRRAEHDYLSPFTVIGPGSLTGATPGGIAAAISAYFGFRGLSYALDAGGSSSLLAVTAACGALSSGELDAVIAGGVELNLDPYELIGLARSGVLATGDVRVYDESPTGYLPSEGCGMIVLMRTADARAADLPVYAQIVGWGASAEDDNGDLAVKGGGPLLAMRRAYEGAGLDPAEIQLFEGNGTATRQADETELLAFEALRANAQQQAVLGSVKANVGHAGAAAGVAGLIKAVLCASTGVLPPTTGASRPHPLINGGVARLALPEVTQDWPAQVRLAGVSAAEPGGCHVHLALRAEPATPARHERWSRLRTLTAPSLDDRDSVAPRLMGPVAEPLPFLLQAPDRFALTRVLLRLAEIGRWLSDGELHDLACMLAREPGLRGPTKVALVAAGQEQLATRAAEAAALLGAGDGDTARRMPAGLPDGLLAVRPGVFAADGADGRVALLLSDDPARIGALADVVAECLAFMRWLETLDVHATGAVGHGLGALPGLAWAGVLGEGDVVEIAKLRGQFLDRFAVGSTSPPGTASSGPDSPPAGTSLPAEELTERARPGSPVFRAAITAKFRLGPPRRRLVSTLSGTEIESVDDAIDVICSGFGAGERLAEAVSVAAVGATLLLETGPGKTLAVTAAEATQVPAISLDEGPADTRGRVCAAAALFAAGAIGEPRPLFAGRPGRPIDIWRERVFLTSPCELRPQPRAAVPEATVAATQDQPATGAPQVAAAAEQPAADPAPQPVPPVHAAEPAAGSTQPPAITAPADIASADSTPAADTASPPATTARADAPEAAEETSHSPATAAPAVATGHAKETADAPATTAPADATGHATDAAGPPATTARASGSGPSRKPTARDAGLAGIREEFERRLPGRGRAAASAGRVTPGQQLTTQGTVRDLPAGIAPWASCFAERLVPSDHVARSQDGLAWRTFVAPSILAKSVERTFRYDPAARRTLAVLGDPADADSRATAIRATRHALETGLLVVICTSQDFTGFFASLQAEHPELGVTVLRVPNTDGALALVSLYAWAEPGTFRELVLAPDGSLLQPVMSQLELPGGEAFPLGPEDVVVVSRGARGAGLALAQVLACCGTPVAVIGRGTANDDGELVGGLERLRSAGARIGYEIIDVTSQPSLAAAIQRIEDRLGPVTAIGHAAALGDPVPLTELTDTQIGEHLAAETATLDRLVGAIQADQLRMIVTFGTVAASYGLAGASLAALSSGALAERAQQLAVAAGNCRSLHVNLPAWATGGLGERPGLAAELAATGTAPIEVSAASRLLLKVLTTADLPDRVALHGRVSGPAAQASAGLRAADLDAAGLAGGGRFLQDVIVHYPGTELICTPRLSLAADPYLADYRVDGLPVLPPALALEALAQAASVLAGQPMRQARQVELDAPIVIPADGEIALRVCAQRTGSTITAALRSAESSFLVDHARAEFTWSETAAPGPASEPGSPVPVPQLTVGSSGLVDGSELYGPIAFQAGRFRRLALLPEVTARSCRALARGADEQPWFEPASPFAASSFVLGSPGLNDAMLHALQSCVPHRRVRLAGCDSVAFSGRDAQGAVEIRGVAAGSPGHEPTGLQIPGQRTAPDGHGPELKDRQAATPSRSSRKSAGPGLTREEMADQQVADSRARPKRLMRGAHKSASAPRHPAGAQQQAPRSAAPEGPPALAVPAQAAAPDPEHAPQPPRLADQRWDVEAIDSTGQLLVVWRGLRLHDAGRLPRNSSWPPSLLSVYLESVSREVGLDPDLQITVSCGLPDTQVARTVTNQSTATSAGPLAGFTLTARAPSMVGCAWTTVEPAHRTDPAPDGMASAYAQLRDQLTEPPATLTARLRAVTAALVSAGVAAPDPASWRVTSADSVACVHTATARIACAVVAISGVTSPVAVALLTGLPVAGSAQRADSGRHRVAASSRATAART